MADAGSGLGFRPDDVMAALGLLSRLPVSADPARGARAAWAFPVAGALLGGAAAFAASVAGWLGLAPGAEAACALGLGIVLTGALHEDGLADTADGFWGGHDAVRRLEIMRDSRIGTYGVLALMLTLLLRWTALTGLVAAGLHWAALPAAGAASRAAMVALMAALPHARGDGLSRMVGRPDGRGAWIAAGLGALICLILTGSGILPVAFWCVILLGAVHGLANSRIGGQTGDVLGATQQLTEVAALLALAAWML